MVLPCSPCPPTFNQPGDKPCFELSLEFNQKFEELLNKSNDCPQIIETTKVVEITKIVEVERIIEIPEIIEVERVIEVPTIVEVERIIEVPTIVEVDRVIEVPEIVEVDRVIEIPTIVEVDRVIEVPTIVEVDRIVEVPEIVEPPTENVLLPTIECDEDGNPVSNPVVVRTLVGAIPVETQEKFHEMAKLAIEQCKDENDDGCNVVLPSDVYSEYNLESQLVITFGLNYPKHRGSAWNIHIPNPIEDLNWCEHFDSLMWVRGNVYGRLFFDGNSRLWTGGYFDSEEEANRVLMQLQSLSKYDDYRIRITKGGSPKRTIKGQTTRAVRASIVLFDDEMNPTDNKCFKPPADGC